MVAVLAVVSGAVAWREGSIAGALRDRGPASRELRELVAGPGHACAVYTDGAVACWSLADRTGKGDAIPATAPRRASRVPGLTGATAVALSPLHGCALDGDGYVDCWSYSDVDVTRPFAAVRVNVVPPLAKLSARTDGSVMCGTDRAGREQCWHAFARRDWFGDPTMSYSASARYGTAYYNEERDGAPAPALRASTSAPPRAVARSWRHTCALWTDERVECWPDDSATPFPVLLP